MSKTLDYFGGDKFRAWVFQDRYSLPGEETMEDVSQRLAGALPEITDMGQYVPNFKFVPGGRILRSLGSGHKLTLFNCLALPAPGDYLLGPGGIMDTATRLATALKRGAGVGFDLSNLRPEGEKLITCGGIASGPVSFMKLYSALVATIQQGGTRRGALLLSLKDTHRDIRQFIFCKDNDQNDIRYANISVRFQEKPSIKILNLIAEAAWNSGEPGIIFEEKINADFGPSKVGNTFESVNACSEIPLPAWGVCCLGAVNLNEFVSIDGHIDLEGIKDATRFGVKFLNAVIDHAAIHNLYPFEESKDVSLKTRQIGIGIMGLAHALMKMGLPYGSPEAQDAAQEFIKVIRHTADKASQNNTTVCAGQPTGTTSILAGTTSGIEPLFALEYNRKDTDKIIKIKDPFYKLLSKHHEPQVFKCAHDIHWRERLAMQGALQEYIDNAISSTVNLPHHTTKQTVAEVFKAAYRLGLKSITIFRDGCIREAVLSPDGCKSGSCDI
jgi:ribonucleoside-diphosphate reductase alpha chain